jgi:hypothetical protein
MTLPPVLINNDVWKILLKHLSAYLLQTLPRQRNNSVGKRQLPDIRFNSPVRQMAAKGEEYGEKVAKGEMKVCGDPTAMEGKSESDFGVTDHPHSGWLEESP